MKKQTSVRLSSEAQEIIEFMSKKLGVSKTDIYELALREYYKNHGVSDDNKKSLS